MPTVIIINKGDKSEEIISYFASQRSIDPAHRIVIYPEKDELTVEQIHLMQKDIQVSFSKKVLVALHGVDDSSNEVQNSLLKSLEEDSNRIQFLFLVENLARLLPTIRSRCVVEPHCVVRLSSLSEHYLKAFSFKNNSDITRDEAVERIDRFVLSSSIRGCRVLHYVLEIRKLIIDNNMNPVLALDALLIFLSKISTMNVKHEK